MPDNSFKLPLGLRIWPQEPLTKKLAFTEGYVLSPLENTNDSHRFSIMVSTDRLLQLIRTLGKKIPAETFFILEFYQNEQPAETTENASPAIYYSPYMETADIITCITPYLPRLIHDGFVGFGLANNREGFELFYSEEKVLTCFTGNHLRFTDLLAKQRIFHRPDLLFPTDVGHDHLSLLCYPHDSLPASLHGLSENDLDYAFFCAELTEILDMYPVEDDFSFFLSKREQDQIQTRLAEHPEYAEYAEEDFGGLLLDWNDFVDECAAAFQGDLWEYRQGLKLRDLIEYVIEGVASPLKNKIREIVAETDKNLQQNLVDHRKRLDFPSETPAARNEHFWYQGIVRNQGAPLRRDLIRQGWYNR
ncbi:MAG: hypothetical protein P8X63_03060 [Desulfuromonadaceae bacterium]